MPSKLETSQIDQGAATPQVERITMVTTVARPSRAGNTAAGLFFAAAVLLGVWVLAVGAGTGAEDTVFRSFEML